MSIPTEPASNLTFTGCLPLAWRELSVLPDAAELRHQEQTNLTILHTLFALDIHVGDDPSALTNASDLKRLDFKVGLLLELVGQLLAGQRAAPPERPLILTVHDLSWGAATAPPANALLQLELYGNLCYPRPLIMHAKVNEISFSQDEYQIKATFFPVSPPIQEALERYIFLQHRRFIANRRGNSQR
jgi:Atypical PilZ domain, cyclic di-GMP receptor